MGAAFVAVSTVDGGTGRGPPPHGAVMSLIARMLTVVGVTSLTASGLVLASSVSRYARGVESAFARHARIDLEREHVVLAASERRPERPA